MESKDGGFWNVDVSRDGQRVEVSCNFMADVAVFQWKLALPEKPRCTNI